MLPTHPPESPEPGDSGSSYSYFKHDADIGISAWGKTLEEAFIQTAEATFFLMGDLAEVLPRRRIDVRFKEEDLELALYQWINLLLTEAMIGEMILCRFSLIRRNDFWEGSGWGEAWREDLTRGIEVKGATMTDLSVRKSGRGRWETRLIVDV